jgi:hypothetical protein
VPHLDTQSTHSSSVQVLKEDAVTSCQKKEERERGAFLREEFMYFLVHCLGIVLAIYIKEVLLGFLPLEGFLG